MAKRKQKRRTHVSVVQEDVPKSMVIKMGDAKRKPTKALAALVRDFRQILQPHTAARLRERKANRLKDYLVMAGPLGVSHFFLFSQSHQGHTTLRIARTPRGPTLYFRVQAYSLCRDIQKTQANPHALSKELRTPPVLVMNGFSGAKTSDKDALVTSMFHNMIPAINAERTKVSDIQRVLLVNRLADGHVELRHYAVVMKLAGTSRAVKKLVAAKRGQRELPDMSKFGDVADFMEDPGLSESEGEDELFQQTTPQAAAGSTTGSGAQSKELKQKRAVKLVEVGPRLRLRLMKIEDGLCAGKTLFHDIEARSAQEEAALEKKHKQRDSLRAQRRKQQEENVQKKRDADAQKSSRMQRQKQKARDEAGDEGSDASGDESENDTRSDSENEQGYQQDLEEMNDYELEAENLAADSDSDEEMSE